MGTFNPILSEIHGLSDAAKGALGMAGHTLPPPESYTAAIAPSVLPPGALLPHPDNAPAPSPISMPSSSPLFAPAANPQITAPRGTIGGDTNARGALLGEKPGVENIASDIEGSRLGQAHPFAGKLLGGLAEGAGLLGDTLLHSAAPGIERAVPGTEGNYTRNLNRADTALTQDTTNAQKEAQAASENATAGKTNAETPEVAPNAESTRNLQGAEAAKDTADASIAGDGKPVETSAGLLVVKPDGSAQRVTVDGQPVGPVVKTEVKQIEVGGKPHQVLINSETGDQLRDLGETGEKPPNVSVNTGEKNLWSVPQPDGSKKVVSLKPGDTIPKGAVSLSGQSTENSKEGAADAPTVAALKFANDYLSSKAFTGPSDEALQDQYFQMAKPASGFRMNQAQIDQLHNMTSLEGRAQSWAHHLAYGTWFSDQQREQIVKTMNDLAASKGMQPAADGAQPGKQNDPLGIR